MSADRPKILQKKKRPDGFKRDLPMHANIHTFMCSCTRPLKRTALSKEINPWIQKYDYSTNSNMGDIHVQKKQSEIQVNVHTYTLEC